MEWCFPKIVKYLKHVWEKSKFNLYYLSSDITNTSHLCKEAKALIRVGARRQTRPSMQEMLWHQDDPTLRNGICCKLVWLWWIDVGGCFNTNITRDKSCYQGSSGGKECPVPVLHHHHPHIVLGHLLSDYWHQVTSSQFNLIQRLRDDQLRQHIFLPWLLDIHNQKYDG